jgi:hypothetical protein
MANDIITTKSPASRALAVFDKPLTPNVITALSAGKKLRRKYMGSALYFLDHCQGAMRTAITCRNERLGDFLAAERIVDLSVFHKVKRGTAVAMITTLYRSMGAKAGEETAGMLAGALDMIESDDIGEATGLWEPLEVSEVALAIACRKLIATTKFKPQPAELRAACKEAMDVLIFTRDAADRVFETVRRADAILLEFNHAEWERPWRTPQYRPMLAHMLELHDTFGDGSIEFYRDESPQPIKVLVEREQAKLALEAKPPKVAAARKRIERKRSRVPAEAPKPR